MNNLVVSVSTHGTKIAVDIGEIVLEPIFDLDKGKAWHGTLKVGDSTIGVYAYSLRDVAPNATAKLSAYHARHGASILNRLSCPICKDTANALKAYADTIDKEVVPN